MNTPLTPARTPGARGPVGVPRPPRDPEVIERLTEVLKRRWVTGVTIFVLVFGAALAVVFLTHPIYRAEAKLRLGAPPPMTGVSPTSGILSLWGVGGDAFANDLELLTSRSVTEDVVETAGLNAAVGAPRGMHRDSLFVSFAASRDTRRATFEAEWTDGGELQVRRTAPSDSVVGTASPGEPMTFGGLTVAFRPWREGMPRQVTISTLPFGEAVRNSASRIVAQRVRREANALDLRFDHTDPAVAETAVRTAVERFVALRTRIQQRESGETTDSLRVVASATLAELRDAEEAMEAFQRSSRVVSPEIQGEAFVERYSEAVSRRALLGFELQAIEELLRRVQASAGDPLEAWAELAAHPHFLENEMVGGLLGRLTELETRRREVATRRTPTSLEYRLIEQEIEELDRTLWSVARGYRLGLEEQQARVAALVEEMEAELSAHPADAIELGRHHRAVRVLSEVLVVTEQRLRQEELREALTFANVQVIDPPLLRDHPVWPRRKLGPAVGFLLAIGFGLLGMVVTERADRTVRRASQVRSLVGAPVLAAVLRSRNGATALAPPEIAAILLRARGRGSGSAGIVVAPADSAAPAIAAQIAGELREASENGSGPPEPPGGTAVGASTEAAAPPHPNGVRVAATGPLSSYAVAAEAAEGGAPVTLVALRGRTRSADLARAADLVAEAGGTVAGVILVCTTPSELEDVWR